MSVMETRAALQASERTKTLSYLATLYLPLSASAVSSHQNIRQPILTSGEVNLQYECSPIINHSVFVLHRTSRIFPHHNHARSLSPAYAFYLDRIDRASAKTCHCDNREDCKSDCGCHVFQRHLRRRFSPQMAPGLLVLQMDKENLSTISYRHRARKSHI